MRLSSTAQARLLLAPLAVCFVAEAVSRNRITVQTYKTNYRIDSWDDGRDEPYRVTFWKFGLKSVYTFNAEGHVKTLKARNTQFTFDVDVGARMLLAPTEEAIENAHVDRRLRIACTTCEVTWNTLCDVGLPEVCFLDDNNPADFNSDAEDSVRRFCSAVSNACERTASDVCDGQCVEGPAPEPTPTPSPEVTSAPTIAPTQAPTLEPTPAPTPDPTVPPTSEQTPSPTAEPTPVPTSESTSAPTLEPTSAPTPDPTDFPTTEPTPAPTAESTPAPTSETTSAPTLEPSPAATPDPIDLPTPEPTPAPTSETTPPPTLETTPAPTPVPTEPPTTEPTPVPTPEPTPAPTPELTLAPTADPTPAPTLKPTPPPTLEPTLAPTPEPTQAPTSDPTQAPTAEPTPAPTLEPTSAPIVTDACNPNPCQNGGSCSIDPAGGHICSCASDFGGMACQTDTSELATFFIQVDFVGTWTDARRAVFQNAADRWSEVITHVPCGGNAGFPAGRLLISAMLEDIDGAGVDGRNVLGSAGPTQFWSGCPTISRTGNMRFDIFDIGQLEISGMLEGVILHEMGHVIGVGTAWEVPGAACSTCRSDEDDAWTCPAALSVYADIGGSGDEIVELEFGTGSACGHLDEAIFTDELMTPNVNNPMFLSKMTAATLDDINYIVDASAVDAYILPSKRGAFIVEDSEPSMVITNTAVEAIIYGVDSNGNVVEERVGIRMEF